MRKLLLIVSFSVLLISCSDNDHSIDDNKTNPTNSLKIGQTTGQPKASIFELVTFDLTLNQSANLLEVRNTYDSLVWEVPTLGRINLLTDNNFIVKWSHNFVLQGNYETHLHGYKHNRIITSDTIFVSVANNRDFLECNWEDIKNGATIGYVDAFKNTDFTTLHNFVNNNPSVDLYSNKSIGIDLETSKQELTDLMTSLYSKPAYTTVDNDLLLTKYKELFSLDSKTASPVSIWLTPKSKIVLLKIESDTFYPSNYKIYAEPL